MVNSGWSGMIEDKFFGDEEVDGCRGFRRRWVIYLVLILLGLMVK